MVSIKEVKIRVTRNQLERIKTNAQAKGFRSVSSYVRYLSLEYNLRVENTIFETNKIILDNNKILHKIQEKLDREAKDGNEISVSFG